MPFDLHVLIDCLDHSAALVSSETTHGLLNALAVRAVVLSSQFSGENNDRWVWIDQKPTRNDVVRKARGPKKHATVNDTTRVRAVTSSLCHGEWATRQG